MGSKPCAATGTCKLAAEPAVDRVIARNFLALGLGEAVSRLLAFGATVYLARTLGVGLYGTLGFAAAIMLYLTPVADAGLDTGSGVRAIAGDRAGANRLVPPVMLVRLLRAAILTPLVILAALLLLPEPDASVLAVYSLGLVVAAGSGRWVLYGLDRGSTVGLWRVAGQAVMVALVLILVRGPADVIRVPLAQLAGDAVTAIALLVALRMSGFALPLRWDPGPARQLLRQGRTLVASTLLGLTIYNSDLIFLRIFQGTEAVGLYAAAYLLISFCLNIGISYTTSNMPALTRAPGGSPELARLFRRGVAQLFAGGLPIALGGALLARELLVVIFGPPYGEASVAFGLLLISVPFGLIRELPIVALVTHGREPTVMRVTGVATAANLALNLILIPPFGIVGAASATLATEAFRLALALWAGRRIGLPLPGPGQFWRASAAGGLMVLLVLLVPAPIWLLVPAGAATYALGLMAVGGLRWRDGRPVLSV